MRERIVLVLVAALAGGMFVFAAWAYDRLPERYPTHFDRHGRADAWSDKSWSHVGLMPVVYAAMVLLTVVLTRYPALYNFPQKQRVARLAAPQRQAVYAEIRFAVYLTVALLGVLLWYVQLRLYDSIVARRLMVRMTTVLLLTAMAVVPVLLCLWRVRKMVRSFEAEQRSECD